MTEPTLPREDPAMAAANVYRRLQNHLDNMPVGFPATESGVELRLLQHLFTPDEAEIALHLSALPEPLDKIHARARKSGLDRRGLKKVLDGLARRGVVRRTRVDGRPHYSKLMLAVGMFEYQVNRLTRDFHSDMLQYMEEGFREAFHTKNTSQMRTIPINEEVIPERWIGTYDGARRLVRESAGPFAVINCVCRQGMDLLEQPCRQTDIRETCLLLGDAARMAIRSGEGKELTKDQMVEILDRADAKGMVLQPQNTQDPHFICCCCGCCCGVLASAKKLPRPAEYFDTNYFAEIDSELCTDCGTCADRCQMDAISDGGGFSTVDILRCIGCGLCVSTCPTEAVRLLQKEKTKIPPKNQEQLYRTILLERFGVLGTARIAGKKLLGMKI
ncbi:ATP-binding protein [Gemmatimonadota bacterium]